MDVKILRDLEKPLSPDAIQRTLAKDTKKGYDTTGYGYQYAVDRFNDICVENWGFDWKLLNHTEGTYKSGAPYHEITVEVAISIFDCKPRSCVGGHTAMTYADALKGAITNGFKKAAAFWGVGRDAFAGTIDDDNKPYPDEAENKINKHFGQPNLDKMKDLPQDIKDGFASLGFRSNPLKAYQLCEDLSWDNDKIKARLNSLATENK